MGRATWDAVARLPLRVLPPAQLGAGRARRLIERNARVARSTWWVLVSGLGEPVFYLLSIGIGLGKLVGPMPAPGGGEIPYAAFVAPGLLAASAMNGAIYESTFNVFFKLKYAKVYDAVLATPLQAADVALGEITTALVRGTLYAGVFIAMMAALGDILSPWAVLALPAAMLVGAAFAACGMAATTYMRGWTDFDLIQLVMLPLFLFSTTFYPLSVYPRWLQVVVQLTPLYQGVTLERGLTLGHLAPAMAVNVGYLAAMAAVGLAVASRRVRALLLH